MELFYDKKLAWKSSIGIISLLVTAILLAISVKIFVIPGIIFAIFGVAHTAGSYKMLIDIFTRRILVEQRGIHFYYKDKEVTFIPWGDINDYSITETRCILRVSGKLHFFSSQLENFEEFEQLIIDQMNLPKEIRGMKLARIDTLPSLGGVPAETGDTAAAVTAFAEAGPDKLNYLRDNNTTSTGFRPSERIKELLSFTGESPEDRLKKLNLMEIVKDKYNPSYAGIQESQEEEELVIPIQKISEPVRMENVPFEGEDDDF